MDFLGDTDHKDLLASIDSVHHKEVLNRAVERCTIRKSAA